MPGWLCRLPARVAGIVIGRRFWRRTEAGAEVHGGRSRPVSRCACEFVTSHGSFIMSGRSMRLWAVILAAGALAFHPVPSRAQITTYTTEASFQAALVPGSATNLYPGLPAADFTTRRPGESPMPALRTGARAIGDGFRVGGAPRLAAGRRT